MLNAGAKLGVVLPASTMVYALGGLSVLNENLIVDFGGPVRTSENRTSVGGTAGIGVEIRPAVLRQFGRPVALFAQYQHAWWERANLDRPLTSPMFDYRFRREDNSVKFGFVVYLDK